MNIVIKRDNKLDYFSMGRYLVKVGLVAAYDKFDELSHYSERQNEETSSE